MSQSLSSGDLLIRDHETTSLDRCLTRARAARETGDRESLLRYLARAVREAPLVPVLSYILAHALLEANRAPEALAQLMRVCDLEPTANIEALTIAALLSLGKAAEARARLDSALRRYALTPDLARVASQLVRDLHARGWIGLTVSLSLSGEASRNVGRGHLEVKTSHGQRLIHRALTGITTFEFALPRLESAIELQITVDKKVLVGSGLLYPPNLAIDGRATETHGLIEGWVRVGWAPAAAVKLVIADANGAKVRVRPETDPSRPGCQRFALSLKKSTLKGNHLEISASLPGLREVLLPDSPLLLERGVKRRDRVSITRRTRSLRGKLRPSVYVVIPVHDAREASLACIRSVRETAPQGTRVVVIDDASGDAALIRELDDLAAHRKIVLLRNEKNLGFVASVNRGLSFDITCDVAILNSDTEVYGDWIQRLQRTTYSARDIASVTPLSNDGSIASYPRQQSPAPDSIAAAKLDRLTALTNGRKRVEVPVGVGHCLFVRRTCLDEIGMLDEATFAKGYGEEVDFCMRARRQGWRHMVGADVFVRHLGAQSFGTRRDALLERSERIINLFYPGYNALIEKFGLRDPIAPARRKLDEARLKASANAFALIVTHGLSGGVERFVRERCAQLKESGLVPLVLKVAENGAPDVTLAEREFPNLRFRMKGEIRQLGAFLGALGIVHIEFHHFLDLEGAVIEAVRKLGIPYDVYLHDYVWICPRVTLIGGNNSYCGEPAVSKCEICVARNGSNLKEHISVRRLRARTERWLANSRRVIAPTHDVAQRFMRYFPDVAIAVQPWEAIPARDTPARPPNGNVRVALIGAINAAKGYEILLACAKNAADRNLPLEFVVIGYSEDDEALFETGKVFVTGKYEEDEVKELIQNERPHIALFPCVWPETWCYALTHAIRSGLPIVGFEFGAIAERLRRQTFAHLVPPDISPSQLNDFLLREARQSWQDGYPADRENPLASKARPLVKKSTKLHGPPPTDVEEWPLGKGALEPTRRNELTVSAWTMSMPQGIYCFRVSEAAPSRSTENLALPAVQISPGPGVARGILEFTQGGGPAGGWLYAKGDAVVVNVLAASAPVLITSVRSPSGSALAIDIERLSGDGEMQAPVPSAVLNAAPKPSSPPPLPPAEAASTRQLSVRTVLHIRNRGDVTFENTSWAGRIGRGYAIEAFSITPLEKLVASDIQYKGLTATGFETPWISEGAICGTTGMAVPLVGFAIRLKLEQTKTYDTEYSGYFQSGKTIGPLRNGAPCRSPEPNDVLEGIQLVISKSAGARSAPRPSKQRNANVRQKPRANLPVVAKPKAKKTRARAHQR